MSPPPLVTAERRAHLRRLKADFDAAFAAIEDVFDRTGEAYLAAEAAYKVWRRAIDADAISLIDDLEALEAAHGDREPVAVQSFIHPRTSRPLSPTEMDNVFAEISESMHVRETIGIDD